MSTVAEGGFNRSLAYLVGIDEYEPPIPSLLNSARDAEELARLLGQHRYLVCCLSKKVTSDDLKKLREQIRADVERDDRVLFYFAGHGLAPDDVDAKERRAGYLLPSDARLEDRTKCLAMDDLYTTFDGLKCRHVLIILDCCYAGRFRWAKVILNRDLEGVPEDRIYHERYCRFLREPAWQLLTSAGQNERAVDVLFGVRKEVGNHSPFAAALLAALSGQADKKRSGEAAGDGVMPLYELYSYLEREVARMTDGRQTVCYFPLPRHETGQYVFLAPDFYGKPLKLPSALPLLREHNPYKGLDAYEQTPRDQQLFFGRQSALATLREKVEKKVSGSSLTVVVGPSGSGKSSLVRAGLMAELAQNPSWFVLPVVKPGSRPLDELARGLSFLLPDVVLASWFHNLKKPKALADVVDAWERSDRSGKDHLLLCIDQFEELLTQRVSEEERTHYLRLLHEACTSRRIRLHVVVTVRSDYAARFGHPVDLGASPSPLADLWESACYPIPPLKREEFTEIIVGPATENALIFNPPKLVEDLVLEVFERPGALPLLSFTLWKLYQLCAERAARTGNLEDRQLMWEDEKNVDGISRLEGAISRHADELYEKLPIPQRTALQRLMLRLVDFEGRELVRRRAPRAELLDFDQPESTYAEAALKKLEESRLLTADTMSSPANPAQEEPSVEISHEALLHGWKRLGDWAGAEEATAEDGGLPLALRRRLTQETCNWSVTANGLNSKYLWNASPYLTLAERQLKNDALTFNRTETRFIQKSSELRNWRQRRLRLVVSAVILGLSLLTALAIWQAFRAEDQMRMTQEQVLENYHQLAWSNWNSGTTARNLEQNPIKAALHLMRAFQYAKWAGDRDMAIRAELAGHILLRPAQLQDLWHFGKSASGVSWSQDEKCILFWSGDGTVQVWDLEGKHSVATYKHPSAVKGASWSQYEKRILSWSDDGTVQVWDVESKHSLTTYKHPAVVIEAWWSQDEKHILSWSGDGTVQLWDVDGRQSLAAYTHPRMISGPIWSQDEKHILSWSGDGVVQIWDVNAKRSLVVYKHSGEVRGASWNQEGKSILSWSDDGTVQVWDIRNRHSLTVYKHPGSVEGARWSRDAKRILSFSYDGTVQVWDVDGKQSVSTYKHQGIVRGASWSQNDKHILSWSSDGRVQVWDVDGKKSLTDYNQAGSVGGASWSHDEKRILSWGDDGTVQVWDVGSNQLLTAYKHPRTVMGASWGREEKRILSWSYDQTVQVWDIDRKQPLIAYRHRGLDLEHAPAWNKDETCILSWGQDGTVQVWDVRVTLPLTTFKHPDRVERASWSGDGKRVLSWSVDGTVQIWDLTAQRFLVTHSQPGRLMEALLSHDGKRILSWSDDESVRVWDVESKQYLTAYKHLGQVGGASWSPDENRILSWSYDGTIQVWNVGGKQPANRYKHSEQISGAAWSPNGKDILSWSSDGTVLIWDTGVMHSLIAFKHIREIDLLALGASSVGLLASAQAQGPFLAASALVHGRTGEVSRASWSPDGKRILSWTTNGTVLVWDMRSKQLLTIYKHSSKVIHASWSQDGKRILSWSTDGTVLVWDVRRKQLLTIYKHPGEVLGASWNQEENRILSWSDDGTVQIWDVDGRQAVTTYKHPEEVSRASWSQVGRASWSHDEKRILSWSLYGTVQIWDLDEKRARTTYKHSEASEALWSKDDQRVLSWGDDGTVQVWTVDRNESVTTYKLPGKAMGASWSRDEKRILSWGSDGTVQLWDVDGKQFLAAYKHTDFVDTAWLSEDEKRILSWSVDGTIHILDLTVTPWVALAPSTPEADLTLQVESHTGIRLDQTGALAPLSRQQWMQRRQWLQALQTEARRTSRSTVPPVWLELAALSLCIAALAARARYFLSRGRFERKGARDVHNDELEIQ